MGMAGTKEALTFKKARSATLGTEYAAGATRSTTITAR
jgi:hypothetical protein